MKRRPRTLVRTQTVAVTVAFLAAVSTASAERPTKRAAMEKAVGGITRAERIAQQDALHAQLEAVMPEAALDAPLRIELTDQDHADLDAPYESGTPLRIGVVRSITPGIEFTRGREIKQGVLEERQNGQLVWAVSFESPGAQGVRLHLEKFSLPPGVEMYFFSPDGGAYGPFTGKGRNGNGDFWTRTIGSDTVVIQLHFTEADRANMTFTISELAHIRGRELPQLNKNHDTWPCSNNVACMVDATCANRGPAEAAKDAIAKMEWIVSQSVYTCTGGLLADTVSATQIPYFLTANHCTSTSIANLETWFNYTTESCNGMCPHNIITGGAPPSDTIGFTVLESSATSDFCFGMLDENPPAGAYFLGWNNSPVAFTNGADLYRISNANYGPQVYSQQDVDTSAGTCGGLPRGNIIYSSNNVGATMGGSSGSPVVNSSGEVVGQLYGCCGTNCADDCDYPSNSTVDGAFAVTWPSVEQYLDPPQTGCNSDPECDDGLYCNGAETCVAQSCQAGTDPCSGGPCDEATDTCSSLQYSWNLNTNPGWTMQGQWAYGQPTGGGGQYGNPDPTSGATGSNVLGYNLNGDYANSLAETHLTTTAINCTGLTNVTLDFQRWLNVEQPAYDHAYLRVSNNGSTWTTTWQNGAEVADSAWGLQTYDISSVADNQATVYIRWTMGTTDGSWQYSGWNIDDIEIWASGGGPECTIPADCDDGLWCNGAEDCVSGSCVAGTAPNCSDGVGCTDDSCNEGTDSCDNVANDGNCDNGLWCDGAETCHATLDCQSGTAPNCNDGVGCTDDSCNEGTDSCDNAANDGNCDNGLWCDGAETCHATLDCQSGTAPNCIDGVACTDDSCNETTDSCDNVPNDANCPDDGLYCNGTEYCDAAADCSSTGDPCAPLGCNETTDTCESVECTVPADCDDGSDCTTDTCVDNVCYNDCVATVSSYPYVEGFESGFGDWVNMGGDDMDWSQRSGSTPSSSTGPSGAHGGTYYIYTEASSPNYPNKTAILEGPCFDLNNTSDAQMTFWYHMYGSAMGTLNVEVSENCITWDNVWSLSSNQGNTWYEANVDLSAYIGTTVTIRFRGVTGSSYTSDMSVDDITVDVIAATPCTGDPECDDGAFCNGAETCVGNVCQPGTDPCPGQVCNETTDTCETAECFVDGDCGDANACTVDTCVDNACVNDCPSTISSYPYAEGFESGWGDWVNASGDGMDWSRNSGSTPSSSTGPSGAHGGSFYMYTESSSPNYPSVTAIIDGPCFDLSNTSDADMTFWYHMYGAAMGTLYVEASEDCVSWDNVWSLSGNQGNAWYETNVDLSAYVGTTITIRFRGVTGSSYTSDMSVDDITVDVVAATPCGGDPDCDDGLFCNGAETCVATVCQTGSDPCPGQSCDEVNDVCIAGPTFEDDFESGNAMGWNFYGPGSTASTGDWEIGDPVGTVSGSDQAQPENAYQGTGCVFTAQNSSLGVNDVDGGVVYLVSPVIDLSGATIADLTYFRWFYNRDTGEDSGDFFVAEASDDNGNSWVNLETLGTSQSANTWTQQTLYLETYISMTSTVRLRFGAADGASLGNIIEAAIDNVEVWGN